MRTQFSQGDTEDKRDEQVLFIKKESSDNLDFPNFDNRPDKEIWNLFRHGDESAFIYLYRQYFDQLGSYGLQLSEETSLVEDAIQDVFIDLRKKRKKLPLIKYSIKSYLFKCLRNKILEYLRQESSRVKRFKEYYNGFDLVMPLEETIIQNERLAGNKEVIIRAINNLPLRQKEVIHYMFYENLSYEEIKEIMTLNSLKSARNLVYKALNKLRISLQLISLFLLAIVFVSLI